MFQGVQKWNKVLTDNYHNVSYDNNRNLATTLSSKMLLFVPNPCDAQWV